MEGTEKGVCMERNRTKKNKGKIQNPEPEGELGYQRAELDDENSTTIQRNIRVLLVGKRQGPSTPSPNWRLGFDSENPVRELANRCAAADSVTARKLCVILWEIQPKLELPVPGIICPGNRRLKKLDQPANAGPSGILDEVHDILLQRNRRYMSHFPPAATLSSSSEVAPYKPGVAPSGTKGKPSHGLKTSKELHKVLNRIWSIEEQQASNVSVMNALRMELDHSRTQIKGLLKEKETSRRKVNTFKHVEGRIKDTVQPVEEDERRLRSRSESLHRKLAQELSEVKSRFSNALKELEREKNARFVLESLCNEFAMGIKDYEQEIRTMRPKHDTDDTGREGGPNKLILHISEAWLDKRLQTKLSKHEKETAVVDKLSTEMEAYLQASRVARLQKENESRRESFPLNELAGSGPHRRNGDLDSTDSKPDHPSSFTRPILIRSSSLRGGKKFRTVSSHHVLSRLIRDRSLSSEGDRIHPAVCHTTSSPVKRWSSKLPSLDSEGSTLKEKLLEARLEGQKSRSKPSKGSSLLD